MKRLTLAFAGLVVLVAAYRYYAAAPATFIPEIRTVTVTTGDVVDTVGATGALEAVTTVQVGSQVSGIIQRLYVDYNSIVHEGDVLMRLDPSLFQTQIEQARANLIRAEADVERFRVAVDDARAQLARAEDLAARDLISMTDLEAAQVTLRSAQAQLKSGDAQVTQAQASLNQNEVNLEHTVIRAPIDGIVISRLVDVGQTVAASLQAPELFVMAADLTKMRVIANIDESDVGRIRPNQRVVFTVDAYPDEEFEGLVSQIRLEPVVLQNVVTYATVVDAPNPDLKLKPGMTATITLEVARRNGVLKVPTAALRFRPTPATFAALAQPLPEASGNAFAAAASPASTPSVRRTAQPPDVPEPDVVFPEDTSGDPERRQHLRERLATMTDAEREAFFETRRGGRLGGDRRPLEGRPARRPVTTGDPTAVPTVDRGATTIDALFGPLPDSTSTGQVWLLEEDQLIPVTVTLGVTDGTATELRGVDDDEAVITDGVELVSFVSTPDVDDRSEGLGGSPLIPQFGRGRRR